MNEEKGVPIRKVRIYTPSVTQPIHLKRHRDLSDKEYKQEYHVANDGNYCMAIYEGTDRRGKTKRSFELVSNLEAARYFRRSADRAARPDLVPQSDADGYPLKCILRPGTMVLFYENSPAELYECTQQELTRRLYKVTGLSILRVQKKWEYGAITFKTPSGGPSRRRTEGEKRRMENGRSIPARNRNVSYPTQSLCRRLRLHALRHG